MPTSAPHVPRFFRDFPDGLRRQCQQPPVRAVQKRHLWLDAGAQLFLPLFDAGRSRAGLDSAKADRDIAVAQYEKAIQTAFREVADALAGRATLGEQLRAQRAQATAEAARFKLSDLRYQNGIASQLDLLDAQRSLFAAQQAVVQTRLQQLQNQVTLYKTLGGGWKEPAPAVASTATPSTTP